MLNSKLRKLKIVSEENKMPKVSVIVPVYNVENYLRECLDSLLNQTLHDIEILCVEDCSTDNSLKILEEYAKKDNRIVIIKHKKNSGLSAARNTAIKHATAPYIMNCDSDDMFDLTACEKMYNAVTQNNVDIAICGIEVFYETETPQHIKDSDKLYYAIKEKGNKRLDDNLINKINASFCNKIVSCDLIKKHKIEFPVGLNYEDAYFYFVYMPWVNKAFFISENLYKYRRRANSIMSETFSGKSNAEDHLKIAFKIYEYYKEHHLINKKYELFWQCFCNFYWLSVTYTSTLSHKKSINKAAKKFIKENCEFNRLSNDLKLKINDIYYNKNTSQNKQVLKLLNFIPILSIKTTPQKKIYKLFGLPLLKFKYRQHKTKICLFGIPLLYLVKQ